MKQIIFISILIIFVFSCQSQTSKVDNKVENKVNNKLVGGGCEGCEAIFEYGDKELSSIDTLPDFQSTKPQLKITGKVLKKDGRTPAENVIVYIYHTNRNGIYETKGDEKNWGKRHGYIRGWIKTEKDGGFTFYTFRPAAYPNGMEPEHIHVTIKEPVVNEYYLDEYSFEDDPMLTESKRQQLNKRGGSGIVKPIMKNGILTVERDLILGLNIPDYE